MGASKIAQRIRNDLLTFELYASAEEVGRGLNEERHRIEAALFDNRRLSSERADQDYATAYWWMSSKVLIEDSLFTRSSPTIDIFDTPANRA